MGGICGFTGEACDKKKLLEKMLDELKHRGPKNSGYFINDNISIGSSYFKITDKYCGDQPVFNEDKSMVLISDGEIYNYLELKESLKKKNHVFYSDSDTEVIIHIYEQYGLELFKYLYGMFAFILCDFKKKIILCARDHFGIKPLYYHITKDKELIFASEIKSLLLYPEIKLELNYKALESYLIFGYSIHDESFFKNIFSLPAGNYFIFDMINKANISGMKNFFVQYFGYLEATQKDFELEIRNSLEKSLHMQQNFDTESAVLLSGGLNSEYISSKLIASNNFTIEFDSKNKLKEIKTKNIYHDKIKKNYKKIIFKKDYFDVLEKIIYHLDEPNADPKIIAFFFAFKMASEKSKICFTGHGANELFCGYNYYQEPSNIFFVNFIPKFFKKFLLYFIKKINLNSKIKKKIIYIFQDLDDRYLSLKKIFDPEDLKKLIKNNIFFNPNSLTTILYLKSVCENAIAHDDESKMQYLDIKFSLTKNILNSIDRVSMSNSIEARFPYLDKKIHKIAMTLPKNLKIKKILTKYVFRKSIEKYVSNDIAYKKHKELYVPIASWLRDDDCYELIHKEYQSEIAKKFFDSEEILKILNDHKNNFKIDNSKKIWCIYIFLI
jgi:asparagine synthase (glutamine-hydrolysing)